MDDMQTLEDLKNHHQKVSRKSFLIILSTSVCLFATFFLALFVGNYELSVSEVIYGLLGIADTETSYVLYETRIPRLLCCILIGAALSTAGLTMQSLFKNPMASPSVLGISSGAAFGASLAISFGIGGFLGRYMIPGMAFLFCFITMVVVYLLARTKYGIATTTLLLAGVAVGAFFNGLVSLLQYIADEDTLQNIVYWTMGSLNNCGWNAFAMGLIPISIGIFIMICYVKELNLISAGEEQASNMGVNIRQVRIMLIIATSLAVGGAVAISGVIGFVGLIVPHIFRMIAGPNHQLLMPLCIVGGRAFMIIVDTISKAGFNVILPVGILTSLLGAPFFIYVMRTRKKEIWE